MAAPTPWNLWRATKAGALVGVLYAAFNFNLDWFARGGEFRLAAVSEAAGGMLGGVFWFVAVAAIRNRLVGVKSKP